MSDPTTDPMDRLDEILAPIMFPLFALIPVYFGFQIIRALITLF